MSWARMSHKRRRSRAASSQAGAALGHRRDLAVAQLLLHPQRERVLLLRGHQLRTVNREQRIALRHEHAREVDVQVFDVPVELRVDVRHAPFVRRHATDRAQRLLRCAAAARSRCARRAGCGVRASGTRRIGRPRRFRPEWPARHPLRAGLGRPRASCRRWGSRRACPRPRSGASGTRTSRRKPARQMPTSRRQTDRHQLHAANGAVARPVRHHRRVHGAVVIWRWPSRRRRGRPTPGIRGGDPPEAIRRRVARRSWGGLFS